MVKTGLMFLLLIVGAVIGRPALAADTPAPSSGSSFERFGLIVQRNIFDPNRRAGRRAEDTSATVPAADTIDLLGTLIDQGQAVAFTEGSNSVNTRTVKIGDLIAEMKVVSISTTGVQLEAGSQKLDWPVGKRLGRREGEAWSLGADSPALASSSGSTQSREGRGRNRSGNRSANRSGISQANQSNQGTSTSSADTLARLRERRRREMGQ